MRLLFTKQFENQYKKLQKHTKQIEKIQKTIQLLQQNVEHPSLRLHKICGKEYWSVSVDMSIRILFIWEDEQFILFAVGKHEQVY